LLGDLSKDFFYCFSVKGRTLNSRIQIIGIGCVVLAMMNLHRTGINMGFKRIESIWEGG
jgi:hypothetical protein